MTDVKALVITITGSLLWKYVSHHGWFMELCYGDDKDNSKDQRALAKTCLNVLPCCYSHVRNATTHPRKHGVVYNNHLK